MAINKTKENPGEMYFSWFLDELKREGYIKEYSREPETFNVLPDYKYNKEKHLKTQDNQTVTFNLSQALNYTYDFRIVWEKKSLFLFTEILISNGSFKFNKPQFVSHMITLNEVLEIVSYVDVKPHAAAAKFGGGKLSTFYTFPIIQKILLHNNNLYINKVVSTNMGKHGINSCLFSTAFTPNRYLFTDAGQQLRKIHFKKTTLMEFVNRRQGIIDEILLNEKKKEEKKIKQTDLFKGK